MTSHHAQMAETVSLIPADDAAEVVAALIGYADLLDNVSGTASRQAAEATYLGARLQHGFTMAEDAASMGLLGTVLTEREKTMTAYAIEYMLAHQVADVLAEQGLQAVLSLIDEDHDIIAA